MLRGTALLVLLIAASGMGAQQWSVSLNDDGSGTISSLRRSGLQSRLRVNGLQPKGVATDCALGAAEGVTCKQWSNIRMEVKELGPCIHTSVITQEEVDSDVWFSSSWTTSGHLYGGPEQKRQTWPLDDSVFEHYSMVTKELDSQGIAEPYWLSSDGYFFYIDPETPLFLDMRKGEITFTAQNEDPYPNPLELVYKESACFLANAKEAHMYAVANYLRKPTGIPDERMITDPIWSTWARYERDINDTTVLQFADEISDHGFANSQLDIDDMWETCYGSLTFDTEKFPDIKGLTDQLKAKGFRVTLWIHPFINTDCQPFYDEAVKAGYLVKNKAGETESSWWNGRGGYVDFTNPEATEWWIAKLRALKEDSGIDSFKFDAGETSWPPQPPVLNGDPFLLPNLITNRYVEAVEEFGDMIEVRVGHHSQNHSMFVRMIDKDSRWDFENGLPTLVTTLLEMNMAGYPLVLPDMVGGNGYAEAGGRPCEELFIRWLQANVFMPSIQYSFVPWDFSVEAVEICKKYTELHAHYADKIIAALKRSVEDGTPANPPIWWIDPEDTIAQGINDEFLLGEDILVAPVLVQGATTRDIYLPKGTWLDPEGLVHKGPGWLRDYQAELADLPFFVRQQE